MKLGICTGGGDCAGLNAAIAAIVQGVCQRKNWSILGIANSFNGLLANPPDVRPLTAADVASIGSLSGTILGTVSSNNPFSLKRLTQEVVDANVNRVINEYKKLKLDGLIVIGGDGTQAIAHQFAQSGVNIIGIPKTIDNDLADTDRTLGFDSAVASGVQAMDCLATTGRSHARAMVLELMGRNAGHLTLHAGLAGGACMILLPEFPFQIDVVAKALEERVAQGVNHHIIVVAEGAFPSGGQPFYKQIGAKNVLGGVADFLVNALSQKLPIEIRGTVLGHIQRGAPTTHSDRLLAYRFAAKAIELAAQKNWNQIVVAQSGTIKTIPMEKIAGKNRFVTATDPYFLAAKNLGISFGS